MKKIFRSLGLISLIMLVSVSMSFAMGQLPPPQTAQSNADVVSPIMDTGHGTQYGSIGNYGQTGHSAYILAKGGKIATASHLGYSTTDKVNGMFSTTVNGGNLSGAGSITTGFTTITGTGFASGKYDENGTKTPMVMMDLGVSGYLSQSNNAYSADQQTGARGGNGSTVEFYGSSFEWDTGHCIPLVLSVHNVTAFGSTMGGTLTWAKQTETKATAAAITGNTGNAYSPNAQRFDVWTYGGGGVEGRAVLPQLGYADFGASFKYNGGNNSYGVAGGTSTVQQVGQYGVISTSSAFATAKSTKAPLSQINKE